jgi:hypothetical protein
VQVNHSIHEHVVYESEVGKPLAKQLVERADKVRDGQKHFEILGALFAVFFAAWDV